MRKYLTRAEAAAYLTERGLPISKNTLEKWQPSAAGRRTKFLETRL